MYHYFCTLLKKVLRTSGIAAFVFCAIQGTSAQSANVTLAWNPNPEPNIAGYRLYYGTASRIYPGETNAGNSTTVTVSGLSGGTVYYFALTSYNTAGLESAFSNEVAYAPPAQTPVPVNLSGTVSYCSNSDVVPNVTLSLAGTMSSSTLSNASGNYAFSTLTGGGSYIVTPTKSAMAPGSAGITTVDVVAVQRHFLGVVLLPAGCRLTAADVN